MRLPQHLHLDSLAAAIAVIAGMRKPWRTVFSDRDYKYVRDLGAEHQSNFPRRIAV